MQRHFVLIFDYFVFISRQTKTSVWHLKKEIWFQGPEIPSEIQHTETCSTVLDSTKVVFVGYDTDKISIFDVRNGLWEIVDTISEIYWVNCVTFMTKKYQKMLMIQRADLDLENVFWEIYDLSNKKWTQIVSICKHCYTSNAYGHLFSIFDQIYLFYDLENSYVNLSFGFNSAYKVNQNGNMTDFEIGYPFSQEFDPEDGSQGFSNLVVVPFYTRNYKNISILV